MIDPAEHYAQVYEALDTVAEDVVQLAQTQAELLAMAETAEQRVIVATEVGVDRQHINERRNYVLRSVLGNTATTKADVQVAGLGYVNKYETPEAQEAAARRVRVYNILLDTVKRNGDVPQSAHEISLDASEYRTERSVEEGNVRLHGRIDPRTGKTWYDLNNPRTVEYTKRTDRAERVVATYAIAEQTTNDEGEVIVTAVNPSSHEPAITVRVTKDDRTWRMNDKGQLELYIPAGSTSLSESSAYVIERQLSSRDEAAQVAVHATGVNVPNIIASFEHPDHANPVPVSIAKSN